MSEDLFAANMNSQLIPSADFTRLMISVLAKGSKFRFQASGFSMSPFIRNGDIITIAPALHQLRFGEVVAFVSPENNRLAVHRIIRITRLGYLTKGDNASQADGYVMRSNVIGRVVRVERSGEAIRVGLGVERVLVAFLSLRGWLTSAVNAVGLVIRPVTKRFLP